VGVLLAQIDLPSLSSEGPDQLRALITTSSILLLGGLALGTIGKIVKSRAVVAVATVLILTGAGLFVVAIAQYG
jgi:hypothetical protein